MTSTGVAVGVGVGLSDLAFVYPLSVLACRREAGMGLRQAVAVKNFWSGGTTQLTLVPYSILVEAGTKYFRETTDCHPLVAALALSCVVGVSLQPIEKKLVVDQLLQNTVSQQSKSRSTSPLRPFVEIWRYGQEHGVRQMYRGLLPLVSREFVYISALSVINPAVVRFVKDQVKDQGERRTMLYEGMGAIAVGFAAGMVSAPLQTVNAMMKDERNNHKSLQRLLRENVFEHGTQSGIRRLFFGAATRSARCGGAGLLYFGWRTLLEPLEADDTPN